MYGCMEVFRLIFQKGTRNVWTCRPEILKRSDAPTWPTRLRYLSAVAGTFGALNGNARENGQRGSRQLLNGKDHCDHTIVQGSPADGGLYQLAFSTGYITNDDVSEPITSSPAAALLSGQTGGTTRTTKDGKCRSSEYSGFRSVNRRPWTEVSLFFDLIAL